MSGMKYILIYSLLSILLILVLIFSLGMGSIHIPSQDVVVILLQKLHLFSDRPMDELNANVIYQIRLPRILLGVLVGAALGVSGAAIQGVFRNPLAEPGLMGISTGASLFAAIVISFEAALAAAVSAAFNSYMLAFAAFLGASLAVFFVYRISITDGKPHIATMLLAGIAINAFAGALTGLLSYLATEQQLRSITFWSLGSLAGANWDNIKVLFPCVLLPILALPFFGKKLNVFALGESQAEMMGVNTGKLKVLVITFSTLAVGAAVAFSGVISFVGLLVPHAIRLVGGVDNRYVLVASALAGALVLTLSDLVARTIIQPLELPIGVITALLGTPVFLYILIRDKSKM
ncbi:FecCD family ABC transporter permease [Sphingobacterium spiritivorum]